MRTIDAEPTMLLKGAHCEELESADFFCSPLQVLQTILSQPMGVASLDMDLLHLSTLHLLYSNEKEDRQQSGSSNQSW